MDEELVFFNENKISVIAVDICPNTLALDTSSYFGQKFSEYVFPLIIKEQFEHPILKGATILSEGKLTEKYSYHKKYAELL